MKITKLIKIVVCMAVMLGLLQACSWNGNSSIASSSSTTNFTEEIGLDVLQVDFMPDMVSNTLRIKRLTVNDGQIVLRLFSPDGEVQWEEVLTAPTTYKHTYDLDTTVGTWKLKIEFENASGSYDISWKASN